MPTTIQTRPLYSGGIRIYLELDTTLTDPRALERLIAKLAQQAKRIVEDYEKGEEVFRELGG